MPINKDKQQFYPGGSIRSPEWLAIVERIGERSGWRCEQCKAPHKATIYRGEHDDAGAYLVTKNAWEVGDVFDAETGELLRHAHVDQFDGHPVTIILTVAHLDNDLVDHSDANLRHWCQLHHNRHDAKSRAANASVTRDAKVGQGRLL